MHRLTLQAIHTLWPTEVSERDMPITDAITSLPRGCSLEIAYFGRHCISKYRITSATFSRAAMASDPCCAAGKPVFNADYTPKGSFEKVDDLDNYVVGQGQKAIIAIYDLFGFDFDQVRTTHCLSSVRHFAAVVAVLKARQDAHGGYADCVEQSISGQDDPHVL